ncbi:MAG TPA: winged helix-turn-helix domain-containing protein [Candidatus Sulfotelmatobacter sp.]|nr:winged helix-turn-helix domain-containing protein [Candidatus Sulfotelmatobacter sp.]
MSEESPSVYAFGSWEIDVGRRELRAQGTPVPLGSRAFEVVEVLVRSARDLVTKDQLFERVWRGAVVGEATLHVHISAIRKALGADRGLLKTASGRGYRLLGDWTPRYRGTAPTSAQTRRADGAPRANNFPLIVTPLIGRASAAQHVRDLVSAYRVVTLTGPGGIGKTTLALKAARHLLAAFDDGGCFVELASLSDPGLVPSSVATALGLNLGGDAASPESVARAVGGNQLLLVLDNCEHLIGAVAILAETFVRFCPRTTILATSREVLRIDGERVYRVPPLDVPAPEESAPDRIREHSAVELFIARTKALDSGFSARAENFALVAAICRRLDGIPLAIEFAAARAAALGIQEVASGLRDRFGLLGSGRRTALPRHQTLRATLDWSHELLSEAERQLLRRLAVFPAGFTVDAAAAVMSDRPQDRAAIVDGIANLVSKSLVALDKSETTTRWYLLETTRGYALEKLEKSGEAGEMARRHAEFQLALFSPFATEGQRQAVIDDLGRYRREIDNLRAALNWAFSPDGDAALGVLLAAAAADFWFAVSLVAESSEWSSKALARIGDAAGTRCEMVLQYNLGRTLMYTRGMTDDAREALTRAMALAREHADSDHQQRVTVSLWLFSFRAAALHDALERARQYEEVARLGDPQSRAVADWLVGIPQIYLGAHIEASGRLERANDQYPIGSRSPDIVRFMGDLRTVAFSHLSLSLLSRGLLDAASGMAVRAIEEARGTNQPATSCIALACAAGFVFLSLGELDVAGRYSDELIDHAYKYALRPYHAVGHCVSGSLAVRRADPNTGVGSIRRGLAEMREVTHLLFYPYFLAELAAALGAIGRIDEGLAEIDTAQRIATEMGNRWLIPEILRVKGELLAQRGSGDSIAIAELFRQSISLAHEQQALYWELSAAISLAELMRRQDRDAEARAVLAPAYDRVTEGFSAPRVKHAQKLLASLT